MEITQPKAQPEAELKIRKARIKRLKAALKLLKEDQKKREAQVTLLKAELKRLKE